MMKGLDIKIKNSNYSQKEGRAELFDELQGRRNR